MKRPKVVILDAYATNPGDLSWDPIKAVADCTLYDRTAPSEVLSRTRDADAVMLNKAVLNRKTIAQAPNLKYVGILATGCNTIDLAAAKSRELVVSNVPGYSTASVAQHTLALLLELTNQVSLHSCDARKGGWAKNADYCYWLTPQLELDDQILGLVGFGQIGQAVARMGQALGMRVRVHRKNPSMPAPNGVEYVSLDRLFCESDVVSLHCPLTPSTAGLVNARRLSQMKPTALLINTSRGPLIQEQELATVLRNGQLAGAAMDVLSTEPPAPDNPLLTAPRCLITPHLAWASAAARTRLIQIAATNLQAFLNGNPINQIPLD